MISPVCEEHHIIKTHFDKRESCAAYDWQKQNSHLTCMLNDYKKVLEALMIAVVHFRILKEHKD